MDYYDDRPRPRFGPSALTPAVRGLVMACVGLFLLQRMLDLLSGGGVTPEINGFLGMVPQKALLTGHVWQFVTYLFVHGSVVHILFNMYFLWMVGCPLEERWGSRRFLRFFFGTGIGAGVVVALVALVGPPEGMWIPVIGASGAIFGLFAAYGMTFPDTIIHVMLVFPMRARYAVLLFGVIEIVVLMEGPTTAFGTLAHVSGMVLGYLYLYFETPIVEVVSGRSRRRRKLRLVVSPPRDLDKKRYIEDQIDPILDKINASGIESLTPRERDVLRRFNERQ